MRKGQPLGDRFDAAGRIVRVTGKASAKKIDQQRQNFLQ
jgi:hypothetical protein